jgi:hypothetical protein
VSDYKKSLIFIFLLVIIALAIVYVGFSMDSLDNSMAEISNNIADGDKEYNEAVNLINNKNYDAASEKALFASDDYNKTLRDLSDIQNNSDNFKEIHKKYINTTITEIELKQDAASNLVNAINYLKNNDNTTGSSYGSQANSLMDKAIIYQDARNALVNNNPDLFK